ncbi:hypothetical protein ILYODFUR_027275 [Ilyodon furcidens]|uniref:Uncharacterized protein n=1 Tax=Ilyodon furcidens TaxID=33524 RepID=A0ABV0T4B6_9TELE
MGTRLPLDNYCMGDNVSAGNKLFNPNWCNELLLISETTMSKDTSRGRGKKVCFRRVKSDLKQSETDQTRPDPSETVIDMHQAQKTSKEIAETTKTGLRTVQRIIKNWKDSGDSSSLKEEMWLENILNDGRMMDDHLNVW